MRPLNVLSNTMRANPTLPLLFLALPLLAAPTAAGPLGEEAQEARTPVAVLRFDNDTGDPKYDNLGRGLAAMMISDLAVVEEIQLVERERLEDLINEMKLQQSGYVDPSTAQQVGLFVGAEYVVTGAFMTVDPDMRLGTRIVRVEDTEIVKTAEVIGAENQLFELQQELAAEFIDGLGLALTAEDRERLRARQESNRLASLEAALQFSTALCLLDNGAYIQAFETIQEVREASPESSIVQLTFDALRARVEEEAKDRLQDEVRSRLGGLFGGGDEPDEPERPAGC